MTPDELARVQEAIGNAYNAWADGVEVEIPDGPLSASMEAFWKPLPPGSLDGGLENSWAS